MQVVHANPLYDLQLLEMFTDGLDQLESQLESMIGWVGPGRVLLGSDYPYDMAMLDCVRHVRALAISDADKATILGGAAARLLARAGG